MALQHEVSWRDVDLQETLTILRQARNDSSLSPERREAISQICFVTDQMYPQIMQRLEQETGSNQSKAASAGTGTETAAMQQDNSSQARTG